MTRHAPEKTDFTVEAGLQAAGVCHGWLYGRHGWPEVKFKVVDPQDGSVVLDQPLSGWSSNYDTNVFSPDGYTGYKEAVAARPDILFRFDATVPAAVEMPVLGVRTGNDPFQRLLGSGETWLAFRRWMGSGQEMIVVLDAATLAERFTVSSGSYPSFGYHAASSKGALYVMVNDGLLAIDVATGAHEVVLTEGTDSGVWDHSPLAAWGDDLWSYQAGEVRLWRKDAGKWENVLRGRLPGWDEMVYATPRLVATSRGLFVKEENRVHFFSAEASRPVLKPWRTARFSETAGVQALWLELDRPWESPVSVRVKSAGGTATAGSDYTAVDQVVTFAPGQTKVAVPVSITADLAPEAHETIRFELAEPDGLSLPEMRQGSGVILASGLQLDEWVPQLPETATFRGYLLARLKDVTAGHVDDPLSGNHGAVYLWDSATGQPRGRTPFSMTAVTPRPHFLECDGRLEGIQETDGAVTWHELDPANGRSLRSRVMSPGVTARWTMLLGGGRVLFVSQDVSTGVVSGTIMSADDPPGVTRDMEIPDGPQYSISMAFACDGRHLAIGWTSGDHAEGRSRLLRWYDARTLELLGEMNVNPLAR